MRPIPAAVYGTVLSGSTPSDPLFDGQASRQIVQLHTGLSAGVVDGYGGGVLKVGDLGAEGVVGLVVLVRAEEHHTQLYSTALIRGRVAQILDGDNAWRIIDRISRKYTGEP